MFAFITTPTSLNITLGSSASLTCTTNKEEASVAWYKNGEALAPDSRVTVEPTLVLIAGVEYSDIALYTCRAVYGDVVHETSARIDITSELKRMNICRHLACNDMYKLHTYICKSLRSLYILQLQQPVMSHILL